MFLKNWWTVGRQNGTYFKIKLLEFGWPFGMDIYLLKYVVGSYISPHIDPVSNKNHYRLNIVLIQSRVGGDFRCNRTMFNMFGRVILFRPDREQHSVTEVFEGCRYVLSVGFAF